MEEAKPTDLTNDFRIDGFVKEGFEEVRDVFRQNLEKDIDRGSSFAAYYKGELVVNIWGGFVEKEADMYWREDTMPCFFSTSKSVSAITISHMVNRGLLDYDEKISKYWPEFGQNGKENITLETYICHSAGLCGLDEPIEFEWTLNNDVRLQDALAKQKPLWTPGTEFGYHALTFAMYLDQIVRRVDPKQRSLSQYFREEIAEPFGIDFYIGLPLEQFYKTPRIQMMFELDKSLEERMSDVTMDTTIMDTVLNNPNLSTMIATINDPYKRALPIGSVYGHGTVKSVAKLHGIVANGGVSNGKTLMSEELVKRHQVPLSRGVGKVFGHDGMFSLGTMAFGYRDGDKMKTMFGHEGYGGQIGMSDPEYKVGFAFASNHIHPVDSRDEGGDTRWRNFHDVLYRCIYKLENIQRERKLFLTYTEQKQYEDSL